MTFVMGILLVINPFTGMEYLAVVMGAVLIADGILGLVVFVLNFKLDRTAVKDEDCVIDAETVDPDDKN